MGNPVSGEDVRARSGDGSMTATKMPGHRCSECPDCGPPTDDRQCAADGCEGLASIYDSYCTPECAEGRCPNCGQPRTAMLCAPDECKP